MSNFLCISNHNNNLDWVNEYTNDYVVYDRSDDEKYTANLPKKNIIKSVNLGYNIYDILTFIIDNYNDLPNFTTFIKGNIFPRHVTKDWFERVKDNKKYTPIFQPQLHNPQMPWAKFTKGEYVIWSENNDSWYMRQKDNPNKYFNDFNVFMSWCFKDFKPPKYVDFAPGANYIVPKDMILKHPFNFYEKLRVIVSHHPLCSESHLIERALHLIWCGGYNLNTMNFI